MIDENAFGVLVSYFAVEDEEYGLEREEFEARFLRYREILRGELGEHPMGRGVRALDFGHAWYLEVADGDQSESPFAWTRRARARLAEEGFETAGIVTYGGRWSNGEGEGFLETEAMGEAGLVTVSHPSEPLRRALYADAATRADSADDDAAPEGWGPGLYLDAEAIEPLGIRLKNEPTPLCFAGAKFYRVGG